MSCLCGPRVSVILQTKTPTQTDAGGWEPNWANTETMSVVLQPIRGGKTYMQGKDSVVANYRIWADGKKDDRTARTISESQQIIYGTRKFNILFVANQLEQGSTYVVDMVEVPFDKGASDD